MGAKNVKPPPEPEGQLHRVDQLVGCGNLLSFCEFLTTAFGPGPRQPLSLVSLDVNHFDRLNSARGFEHGDSVLRWIGLVLADETGAPVYRVGGDEFIVILSGVGHARHEALAQQVFDRLNSEAEEFHLQVPAAAIAVLHYTGRERLLPADVLIQLGATIFEVKDKANRTLKIFPAGSHLPVGDATPLRWMANLMVERIVSLGAMLDESNHLAHSDPLTGLPNMRAAQQQLIAAITQAGSTGQAFSLLLIDGDDLKRYNQISYAAGDEMIQRLGKVLHERLRPGDFLARWRVGDEFLVLLPSTRLSQAVAIGERLCASVKKVSENWPLPVTISIGVSSYAPPSAELARLAFQPEELLQIETLLLSQAETANDRAKTLGKNRVVAAD